jgi:hypothetical protein
MIVEWSLSMHFGKAPAHLQRPILLETSTGNLTLPEAENRFAAQRWAATLIGTGISNFGKPLVGRMN